MHILIYSKDDNIDNWKYIKICIEELNKKKIQILFLEEFYNKIKSKLNKFNIKVLTDKDKIDFLISFGGDGTMLSAANFIKDYKIPIIGVNTGRLGFLANVAKENILSLISDLEKLINKQNLSYKLNLKDIPISNNLKKLINLKKIKKLQCISHGDDYQILFTASKSKSRIIAKTSKSLGIKISKVGKIYGNSQKSQIIDEKNKKIRLKYKGYFHKF